MIVPNFKILGTVVPEKSLTKKMFTHTHTHTNEKAKTIYPLYTSYTGGITKDVVKFEQLAPRLNYRILLGVWIFGYRNLDVLYYCRFGNVCKNLIFADIHKSVSSWIQNSRLYWKPLLLDSYFS